MKAGNCGLTNTFLSIDSLTVKQQSWKGLPPEYLVYSKSLTGDVGKVKVQLLDCQVERLVHSIQAFLLQYENSFDGRCFDFREKEHVLSSRVTNDNPDEVDYPSEELAIVKIHCDIKCIDISIHHNINMFRYQHITRCICPYGIRIKSSSEATLEFAKRTVITCSKIELQHLISTTKPTAVSDLDFEQQRGSSQRSDRGRNRRGKRYRGKSPSPQPMVGRRQRRKHEKATKTSDELLCIGSLDSHFQIILTTERSDQETYQSKQRDFETRQLQQTEDDVEMDQDWPFHLLNTIYMQEPLPRQRSPNRNPKIPPVQQTELEYELYGKHNEYIPRKAPRTATSIRDHSEVRVQQQRISHIQQSVPANPPNPFGSDFGGTEDSAAGLLQQHTDKKTKIATGGSDSDDSFVSAEEFPNTASPLRGSSDEPPRIETKRDDEDDNDDENTKPQPMKHFHVSNYMAKYRRSRGPAELGSALHRRQLYHVNADYVALPDVSYQIVAPSLLRKYLNNPDLATPRFGAESGWNIPMQPKSQRNVHFAKSVHNSQEALSAEEAKSTLNITYRTHVNVSDNTSIVITPEFLDSLHVYMRLLLPKAHSLSEVLDEMQSFVCDFYDGTYNPYQNDIQYGRNRHSVNPHPGNSRMSVQPQNTPTFDQFEQKHIVSAMIGTVRAQSLERMEKAPGIFLLDGRLSHISIEHSKSYAPTPWKTVVGPVKAADTLVHFGNASFQGFRASPSVDRRGGLPIEIKEYALQALLFETENAEYFVGIEISDLCFRRTRYTAEVKREEVKEDELEFKEEVEDPVVPAETMINMQQIKISTSSTAFASIATLIHRFKRYTVKISQEIPWQNALKMDRLKLVSQEMLTAVNSLQNIKSQPWHRHFLEWLQFRIQSRGPRYRTRWNQIKDAMWGWDGMQKQFRRNNYTRATGIAFMVIIRNLIGNLAPRVERKLNDGFQNVAQQYLDPQHIHSHHAMNRQKFSHRYGNQGNSKAHAQNLGRTRHLFAAQKQKFYARQVDEFSSNKRIADPIIRQCLIELTKELQLMFFPKENTSSVVFCIYL